MKNRNPRLALIRITLIFSLSCFAGLGARSQTSGTTITTPSGSLASSLIGEWRNRYVRIRINTYHNSDSAVTMEADSTNWEARLHIKPIRTHYLADGSYYSEYRNGKDSIILRRSGVWMVAGDTLVMTQKIPKPSVLKLHLQIAQGVAIFSGLIDFDGDGKADDEYYGIQKKFD
jgi:hypothetical protein